MPKLIEEPIVKINLRIFARDYEAIKRMASREVTANELIRSAIHSFVINTEDAIRRRIDEEERNHGRHTAVPPAIPPQSQDQNDVQPAQHPHPAAI